MSVSAIGSSQGVDQTEMTKRMAQGKKDFEALQKALDSGDLDAAKSAFATMKKNRPSGPPPGAPPGGGSSDGQGKGGPDSDFASLESALSSGDISAAKKAFETIKTNMKNHHHGSSGDSSSSDLSSSVSAVASRSASTDLVGSLFDTTA